MYFVKLVLEFAFFFICKIRVKQTRQRVRLTHARHVARVELQTESLHNTHLSPEQNSYREFAQHLGFCAQVKINKSNYKQNSEL